MAEDKEQRMEELDRLRKGATTIIRDGKEYKVVIIPDKYAWGDS